LIYRCGSALYVPSVADQARTGIMLDSLSEGRKLYVNHCGSCHNLYLPERYDATEWEKNVSEMQEKGKITNIQKVKILYYVKSGSKTTGK
jgi:cytochrome c5